MFTWFRNRRRRKLLEEPFPPWWEVILQRNVALYPRLSPAERAKLRDILRILHAEKTWESANSLHVTEEMKITIAAQAALLLLGVNHDYFARVSSIVVYPSAFATPNPEDDWEDDELSDRIIEGQAVYRGPVILAWNHVLNEGRDLEQGHNLVIHEFAHQLDFLDDVVNGTPPLDSPQQEARWHQVMQVAFDAHVKAIKHDTETIFTEHAAENETEFFADAAEVFYCAPVILKEEHPEVYDLLAGYFRVNPLAWFPEGE